MNRFEDRVYLNSNYTHTVNFIDCPIFLCFRWEDNWYFVHSLQPLKQKRQLRMRFLQILKMT